MEKQIRKIRLLLSAPLFIIVFAVYYTTLAPGVTFTDSGELAAVCSTLGVAHPTGYPLFTLLGYLLTWLPLSASTIFELNIFAAVLTTLSSVVLANAMLSLLLLINDKNKSISIIRKDSSRNKYLSKHIENEKHPVIINFDFKNPDFLTYFGIPFLTSLTYSFAITVWEQGTAIEVYSLHLLLMNLALWALFSSSLIKRSQETAYSMSSPSETNSKQITSHFLKDNKPDIFYLSLAAFLLGLGFSNHLTTMLMLPAFLFFFLKPPGARFSFNANKRKDFLLILVLFVIGFSLYLYLPIRSACLPVQNWGWTHRGLEKFFYHIQGKQYQVWMFSGWTTFFNNFLIFVKLVPSQLGWLGLIPMFAGFWAAFKLSKEIFWFLILFIFISLIYSLNYSIHDIDSYFLQTFTGLIIFSGLCLFYFRKYIKILIIAALIIPIINISLNYTEADRSDDIMVEEYSRIMMDNLEPNAIIISSQWDYWCSAFWYYKTVEKRRTDVTLIELELLRRTWYPLQLQLFDKKTCESCKSYFDDYMQTLDLFESGDQYNPMEIQSQYVNMINCIIDNNFDKRPIYVTLDVIQKEQDIAGYYRKIPRGFAFKLDKSEDNPNISVDNIDISLLSRSIKKNSGHLAEGIAATSSLNLSVAGNYALSYNDFNTAKKAYQKALLLDPNNQMAIEGMKRSLELGVGD